MLGFRMVQKPHKTVELFCQSSSVLPYFQEQTADPTNSGLLPEMWFVNIRNARLQDGSETT
jgi:hypothetical protein